MKLTKVKDNPYSDEVNPFIPTHTENAMYSAFEDGKQAQLEACEKEAQEKVKEIFEELEPHFRHSQYAGLIHWNMSIEFWQALKQKYLKD